MTPAAWTGVMREGVKGEGAGKGVRPPYGGLRCWETAGPITCPAAGDVRAFRACYGLCAATVTKRCSIRQEKARKCKPATTAGKRS